MGSQLDSQGEEVLRFFLGDALLAPIELLLYILLQSPQRRSMHHQNCSKFSYQTRIGNVVAETAIDQFRTRIIINHKTTLNL